MPKVQRDEALLQEVQAIAASCGGFGKAARILNVNKATLWRFCNSGCAIERTRQQLELAVKQHKSETVRSSSAKESKQLASDELGIEDLRKIRSFCQTLITLVDTFEKTMGVTVYTQQSSHDQLSSAALGRGN